MARDDALDESDDDLLFFAPIHAWRVLGQLRAEVAVRPLIDLFEKRDAKDDWFLSDLPKALGMIGPAGIPPVAAACPDPSRRTTQSSNGCAVSREIAGGPQKRDFFP